MPLSYSTPQGRGHRCTATERELFGCARPTSSPRWITEPTCLSLLHCPMSIVSPSFFLPSRVCTCPWPHAGPRFPAATPRFSPTLPCTASPLPFPCYGTAPFPAPLPLLSRPTSSSGVDSWSRPPLWPCLLLRFPPDTVHAGSHRCCRVRLSHAVDAAMGLHLQCLVRQCRRAVLASHLLQPPTGTPWSPTLPYASPSSAVMCACAWPCFWDNATASCGLTQAPCWCATITCCRGRVVSRATRRRASRRRRVLPGRTPPLLLCMKKIK